MAAKKTTKIGTKLNPMDGVDFESQEKQLLARAKAFRANYLPGAAPNPKANLPVKCEVVDIYSDGTRMSGTVWTPKSFFSSSDTKLPGILLCHGWGGKRGHLDFSYAPNFSAAGFIVLTFDYRSWGDSDGMLIKSAKSGEVIELRKVIDPEWQLRDIDSAFSFLKGLSGIEKSKIGIWGSSLGGGHVIGTLGRRGNEINSAVVQIGSIDTYTNWINRHPEYKGEENIAKLAIEHSKGTNFPWTISQPIGLDGRPNLPKLVFEHTKNTIGSLNRIPKELNVLLLAAEEEELFPNEKNSLLVYEKLKSQGNEKVELKYLPGGHYDAYNQPAYGVGLKHALHWFQLFLLNNNNNNNNEAKL